jgi:uroporphyrinogen decarboxylase
VDSQTVMVTDSLTATISSSRIHLKVESSLSTKPLLRVLAGERTDTPPIWFMRQAGRYLPEYRELRKQTKNFLDFCYAPAIATEAVMQPLRRYPLDAAILFSDILVVPHALGRDVQFLEGEGPRLDPLIGQASWSLGDPQRAVERLAPVYEAVERIKAGLPEGVALIGFAGGPWTVATYMLQGRGGEKDACRAAAYSQPGDVDALLAVLVEATAQHLVAQVKAGAEVLQVFESWAEGLSEPLFERLILKPTAALVARVRALGVTAPIIGFPRGGGHHIARFAAETGVTALGIDTGTPVVRVRPSLPKGMPLQGNLDPQLLVVGGDALRAGVRHVLADFAGGPHIFNLGHGITPDASPEHVTIMIETVRGSRA